MKSVALFDFEDSFTFNVYSQLLSTPGFEKAQISVHDWREITLEVLQSFDVIIFGPGPGHPQEYRGILSSIHRWLHLSGGARQSFMGVCLGHQLIWSALGARVERSYRPLHGHTETFLVPQWEVFEPGEVGKEVKVQRYNSLAVCAAEESLLNLTSVVGNVVHQSEIQASMYSFPRLSGISFQSHPESVGTSCPNLFFSALVSSYEYNVGDGSTNRRTL